MDIKKYNSVLSYVHKERERRGMEKLTFGSRPEGSCIAFGEAFNLVECQLIPSDENCEQTWGTIRRNADMLELAYNYVEYGSREGVCYAEMK